MRYIFALALLFSSAAVFAGDIDDIIVRKGSSTWVFGDVEADRVAGPGDKWASFERDGVRYFITDPDVLGRLHQVLREQEDIGMEHGRLGAELGRVGAELGTASGQLGAGGVSSARQRELEGKRRQLMEKQRALAERQRELALRQQKLARSQRDRIEEILGSALNNGLAKTSAK